MPYFVQLRNHALNLDKVTLARYGLKDEQGQPMIRVFFDHSECDAHEDPLQTAYMDFRGEDAERLQRILHRLYKSAEVLD